MQQKIIEYATGGGKTAAFNKKSDRTTGSQRTGRFVVTEGSGQIVWLFLAAAH